MSEYLKYSPPEARTFIALGALSLATTFLASRGDTHSRIHKEIAKVALCAEAVTTVAGLGLLVSKDTNGNKFIKSVGNAGLGVTALCYITDVLTDEHIINHIKSGKGVSGPELLDLGQKFYTDFKRHMRNGTQLIFFSKE